MASLKDTQRLTQDIEGLVKELRSELGNGEVDFEKLISIADQISERADGLAETFTTVNDTLMQRLDQVARGGSSSNQKQSSKSESKTGSRS